MNDDDKRNTLIDVINKRSKLSIKQLQEKSLDQLVDIGSMIGTLLKYEWKTKEDMEDMSYDDIRNHLINKLNKKLAITIPHLQSKSDSEIVQIACGSGVYIIFFP